MQPRLQALGRLRDNSMNLTEARYEESILKPMLQAGEIKWYQFEGIKLRLADRTFLTVDFAVLSKNHVLEMHDVKGHKAIYMEDAKVKMKVAASLFPFVFKVAFCPTRKGGEWEIVTI